MRSPCCLRVCVSALPPLKFWMTEPIFIRLSMCIMAPEPISTAYFINPSHQSVSMCNPSLLLVNGSVNTFQRQRIHATIDEFLDASFTMRSVSYQRKVVDWFFPELLVVLFMKMRYHFRDQRVERKTLQKQIWKKWTVNMRTTVSNGVFINTVMSLRDP
jgi:hypothetical protein